MPNIKFVNFEDKKTAFAEAVQNGDQEAQASALSEMIEALSSDVRADIFNQVQSNMQDQSVLQARGTNMITSEEREFFNAVIQEGGFKDKDTLPKTTQERVFQDLVESHPLLQAIGIQNLGAVTEFIYSDPEGAAVWGELFGDIKGQLNATFRKEKITQLKLTAFIPIANDMLQLGPVWVERYVRTMIAEAMSVGLERGYVAGDGQSKPIGLLYKKEENGAVTLKESAGTLTFRPGRTTINELKGVVEKLSIRPVGKDGEEKVRNIAGKVVMVVNPFDSFGIQANSTIQNSAGAYVQSLPFNPTVTTSSFVPKDKVLFFVRDQYIAAIGGAMTVNKFTETMAMEDATLYIAKQFATGKPVDNYAAQVYDLNLAIEEDTATPTTPEEPAGV
ncbi:phage major capsid protein, HK97 family [Terribacillus aidingensis]|uniref:Phage major capsid protein, HK97 family n=1 Tax=Terribacillus aidingensis TaxID=586416 RepID=A0A285NYN2_9BACI|nr:phage major capsid protein [Terribacillus aidingensis]SNZ14559.1 phage major capsid protein, HK97 family [Terribacillus aidingensis]